MSVICFDLWNTLISSPTRRGATYAQVLVNLGVRRDQIYPFVRDHLMNTPVGTYEELAERLFAHFRRVPRARAKAEIARRWREDNERAQWCPGALHELERLRRQGHTLVLITNTTQPGWETVEQVLGISHHFERCFLSCVEQVSKPDRRVWEIVASWFSGTSPSEFTMVGDNLTDDLATPREMGWKVLHVDPWYWVRRPTIIVDTPKPDGVSVRLADLGLAVLDFAELTADLQRWDGWKIFKPDHTLLVSPGNGGAKVCTQLGNEWVGRWPHWLAIKAKRCWSPGSDPYAMVDEVHASRIPEDMRDIVVVDDVISSGSTCKAVREAIEPFAKDARFHVVSLIRQRASWLRNFHQVYTPPEGMVGLPTKRLPVNSLSTLVNDPALAQSYAERNLGVRKEEFFALLQTLDKASA